MHRSRLCAILIDCKATPIAEAGGFWSRALPQDTVLETPNKRRAMYRSNSPGFLQNRLRMGPRSQLQRVLVRVECE